MKKYKKRKRIISVQSAKETNLLDLPKFDVIKKLHCNGYLDTVYEDLENEVNEGADDYYQEREHQFYFSVVYKNKVPVAIASLHNKKEPYLMAYTNPKHRGKGYAIKAVKNVVKFARVSAKKNFMFWSTKMASIIVKAGFRLEQSEEVFEL